MGVNWWDVTLTLLFPGWESWQWGLRQDYLWKLSSLSCKMGRHSLVYNWVRINVYKNSQIIIPFHFLLFQQCAFVGWGLGRKINSPKRTSNVASTIYLKTAQVLKTKISSLFLEKSFPVLLEFLPHWVLFYDRITFLCRLACYITWYFQIKS